MRLRARVPVRVRVKAGSGLEAIPLDQPFAMHGVQPRAQPRNIGHLVSGRVRVRARARVGG